MRLRTTRLRFSEEELERFISDLWILLERNRLPSPHLRLFNAAPGATTIELRFAGGTGRQQFLQNWIQKRGGNRGAVTLVTVGLLGTSFI
jgi:hypothetical protein